MKLSEIDFLKINSQDKHEFIISKNAVLLCPGLIKAVEDLTFANERVAETTLAYNKHVIRGVLDYLHYKMRYLSAPDYGFLPPFNVNPDHVLDIFKLARQLGI